MNTKAFEFLLSVLFLVSSAIAQTPYTPDLRTALRGEKWNGKFVSAELTRKDSTDALMITKAEGDQFIWLKDFSVENGTIEFDAKGKSGPPQSSFIGIVFRVVDKDMEPFTE